MADTRTQWRVAIATRIFEPEPSAASFRLAILARRLETEGHATTVLTVRAPRQLRQQERDFDRSAAYAVRRTPVHRDRTGYVRGYLQYLSFDVPLFFRVLFGRRFDAIIVEPPPTTGLAVLLATALRRTPFVSYAADIWSDAAAGAGAPGIVARAVRSLERWAWRRASVVLAVNEGVAERVRAIAPSADVEVVGNGVDTAIFRPEGAAQGEGRFLAYMGTASEWQGADVFVRAVAQLSSEFPDLRLKFVGQGSAWAELRALASELDAPVDFIDQVPPAEAAEWLRGAALSVASIRPGANYEFAFPTKIFASWAVGTPVVYAGPGPARQVLAENTFLGCGVEHDLAAVIDAVRSLLLVDGPREAVSAWAEQRVSLNAVAQRAERAVREVLAGARR